MNMEQNNELLKFFFFVLEQLQVAIVQVGVARAQEVIKYHEFDIYIRDTFDVWSYGFQTTRKLFRLLFLEIFLPKIIFPFSERCISPYNVVTFE